VPVPSRAPWRLASSQPVPPAPKEVHRAAAAHLKFPDTKKPEIDQSQIDCETGRFSRSSSLSDAQRRAAIARIRARNQTSRNSYVRICNLWYSGVLDQRVRAGILEISRATSRVLRGAGRTRQTIHGRGNLAKDRT
jgi:hypothetical protein